MYFFDHFAEGVREARGIRDWHVASFSWAKAYVCSVMSLAAYEFESQYEVPDAPRAKLIPSEAYQRAMWLMRHRADLGPELQRNEVELLGILGERFVVAVLARVGGVVFVALRGTQSLYDLITDLKVQRVSFNPGSRAKLHRGFAQAVGSCLEPICALLNSKVMKAVPLCITGHSLGGAMAAILYARFHELPGRLMAGVTEAMSERHPLSSFAFGMPRYGNADAVARLPTPFHVYDEYDFVPTIPNRLFGYSDLISEQEYCLRRGCILVRPHRKGSGAIRLRRGSRKVLGLAEHRMESYVSRVQAAFKVGLPV